MTDLLTHEEYQAIAAGLTFPTAAFIDGAYRPAASGKTFIAENCLMILPSFTETSKLRIKS